MKILNLYACLGGNRYKWDEVAEAAGITIQVTAVENDPELARLYQERFPNDIVIVGDAHQYLLDHYRGFDFIWSSPPCPTHSKMRITNPGVGPRKLKAVYPDMKLYQEIIFLQAFFKGKYIVENVTPYYEPLISAEKRGRHLYWSNFRLPSDLNYRDVDNIARAKQSNLEKFHEIDLSTYRGKQRRDKIARNLVDYEAGKTILQTAMNVKPKTVMQDIFTLYDD